MNKLLTLEETAERLRKTPAALRWQMHAHPDEIPKSALIGNRRVFREADVDAFIEAAFSDAVA